MIGATAKRVIGGNVAEVILGRDTEGEAQKYRVLPTELWSSIGDFCDRGSYNNLRLVFASWINRGLAPLRVPARYLKERDRGDGLVLQERYKDFGGLREVRISGERELGEFLKYLAVSESALEARDLKFYLHLFNDYPIDQVINRYMEKMSGRLAELPIVALPKAKVGYLHVLNPISYACLFSFLECFSSLNNLEVSLKFSAFVLTISESVAKLLSSLVRLQITCGDPCDDGKNQFFSLLGSCSQLQTFILNLTRNSSANMFRELLSCKGSLANLEQLEIKLSPGDINKFPAQEVGDFLCSLPSLKKLTMPLNTRQLSFLLGVNRFPNLQISSAVLKDIQIATRVSFVDEQFMLLKSRSFYKYYADIWSREWDDYFLNKDVLLGLGKYWSKLTEFEVLAGGIENFVSVIVDPAFKDIWALSTLKSITKEY